VRDLAVGEDGWLYVGGTFETAGPIVAANIARWNGTSWSEVGSGLDGSVQALAVYDGDLYAGGDFVNAGALAVQHLARWDGSAWSDVGGGMGGSDWPSVLALTVYEGDLVAGGWFESAGGVPAAYIARWDGTAWSALGGGVNFWVLCLTAFNGELVAGGQFTFADEQPAPYIARWNGSGWGTFAAGMDGWVEAVQVRGDDLFAGGLFTRAGTTASYYVAQWRGVDPTAIETDDPDGRALALESAGANPTGTAVAVRCHLPGAARATLTVHDVQGRLVTTLFDGPLAGGWHPVAWDGTCPRGTRVPPGVYWMRLASGGERLARRVVLVP